MYDMKVFEWKELEGVYQYVFSFSLAIEIMYMDE